VFVGFTQARKHTDTCTHAHTWNKFPCRFSYSREALMSQVFMFKTFSSPSTSPSFIYFQMDQAVFSTSFHFLHKSESRVRRTGQSFCQRHVRASCCWCVVLEPGRFIPCTRTNQMTLVKPNDGKSRLQRMGRHQGCVA
jgi:hypothetical protein